MALRPALDLELLRTLVFIGEEASFTKAAEKVGRTQSAVTLQVQKLEGLVGQTLVIRSKGGPVELTPQGHALVVRARAMLRLNDEAMSELAPRDVAATIRFGASATYLPYFLERALERFREAFPHTLVEVTDGASCQIAPLLREGALDLALCQQPATPPGWEAVEVFRKPLQWITASAHSAHLQEPLPLCTMPGRCPWLPSWMEDCFWRTASIKALDRAKRRYRIVASATFMEAVFAPVLAGRAVTVSPGLYLPEGLRVVEEAEGLPPLADDVVVLLKGRNAAQPYTDAFAAIVAETFARN